MKTKENIRTQIRKWRASITPDWVTERSRSIEKRLVDLDDFKMANTVCLYMAVSGEVRLDTVIQDCWELGKRVLVPAYRQEHDDYGFKEINANTKMTLGPCGVPEPKTDEWSSITKNRTCIVVPGVAFDNNGVRVGHGKGYYDRLLAFTKEKNNCTKIGVCFDFQRIDSLPSEEWDIGMDIVLSESCIIRG